MPISTVHGEPTLTAVAPKRKTLYLMVRKRLEMRASSESLAAFEGKVCRGRFPLVRISRVLATRQVDWRGDAIRTCLNARIPICFLDGHGAWYGTCEPALTHPAPITELLDELIEDARWEGTYDNFMRHLRSRALRAWQQERSVAPQGSADHQDWLRCFVYHAEPPVQLRYDFRGLLLALVNSILHSKGVRARYYPHSGPDLDLAEDLCALVYGAMVMRAGSLQLYARQADTAVRLFESATGDYADSVVEALDALQRLLLRRSRQWR